MGNVVVKLENVRKKIGGTEIIRGLSFEVREGEVYGFLGPNGSGKTTTIRMMTGLISMTEGDITICGHSIRTEREKALEQIGAIVENPELYDYMTGMQNLKHFANMAITPISKERIAEIVKLVELEHAIHKKVKTYSLGMKQRLGIAQALLHQPKILILDEPTNGLDPAGIRQIRDYLQRLAKEENIAVIVSSHLLSEIELMCDRVVIIKQGEFVQEYNLHEQAKHDETVVVAFEVDQVQKANEIITGKAQGNVIVVSVTKEEIPQLVKKLVNEDVLVYGVTVQNKTLEDEFLAITGGVKA
ncbi:ABC transporter ATP-binding protein [Bacillus tropicus]|uniref:ABC transporter ATP-binding protein n=1 Tax=Bacillus tropicus TaxID=2026188 RepID=UPI000B454A2F|nr:MULTISPECIES: ABC transporter ATP-binding protein [Bacillus cereus group]MED1304668.1 ABC transporter ATP-binding protein [Bacillus pacificus]MDF9556976.1 ABC transporter ATP-binding protein [Bacillus tropicus]MDF9588374.1 ABC transporter ATP-binding protein [Bacillus tropicus]MDF9645547.1 ABC transporter ATP-binding protein [Bacillus tropicus]OUB16575.1 ABC transporter ATP-binding protein [[Bacillus thuringiensis] serovar konkukian]